MLGILFFLSTRMIQSLKWTNGVFTIAMQVGPLLPSTMARVLLNLTGQGLSTLSVEFMITARMARDSLLR
ncbi:hypothetical protein Pint_29655 [Pistacia integerrima]|uniref:Uncharacterized protein n=1 Tax=Pistacia integerrima TaxID=434235 RepID=A0ACC0WZF5_9ROSI|nr:hypothetical protein Pint_29655 [Pistacia integerrima]